MRVAHRAVRVDEVFRGPRPILESPPRGEFIVLNDGVVEVVVERGLPDVVRDLLELELRRVHAQYHQASIGVLLVPVADPGKGPYAVDAGVRPEIDEDHLALPAREREGLGVDPLARAGERGRGIGRRRGLTRHRRCRGWFGREPSPWVVRASRSPWVVREWASVQALASGQAYSRRRSTTPRSAPRSIHQPPRGVSSFVIALARPSSFRLGLFSQRTTSSPMLDSTPECCLLDVCCAAPDAGG